MKTITKQIKSERRKDAEQRQEEYSKLTDAEKMQRLPIFGAAKQWRNLMVKHWDQYAEFLRARP